MNSPIAIIAFNRPEYFVQVLDSLAAQQDADLSRIALFQDGMVNPHSGKRYGDESIIRQNAEVFRVRFPDGCVFTAPENLGVALNYDRAERWIFEELDAEAGIFFEDDMVVSPHYVRSLEAMLEMARNNPQVGYVACYGSSHRLSVEAQSEDPARYEPLRNNWGFGLTRRQWRLNQPYVDAYLQIVAKGDYRVRDYNAIAQVYRSWGIRLPYTTQDVVKTAVCSLHGCVKLNTRACLGKYIGARGLHTDERGYRYHGCHQTEVYPEALLDFTPPDAEAYRRCFDEQNRWTGRILNQTISTGSPVSRSIQGALSLSRWA